MCICVIKRTSRKWRLRVVCISPGRWVVVKIPTGGCGILHAKIREINVERAKKRVLNPLFAGSSIRGWPVGVVRTTVGIISFLLERLDKVSMIPIRWRYAVDETFTYHCASILWFHRGGLRVQWGRPLVCDTDFEEERTLYLLYIGLEGSIPSDFKLLS